MSRPSSFPGSFAPSFTGPVVRGLAGAVPSFTYDQEAVAEFVSRPLGEATRRRLRPVFAGAGVARRHSVLPDFGGGEARLFRGANPDTAERMRVYAEEAPGLGARTASAALREAGCAPTDVTHLLWVSCTGFAAPGPDRALGREIGLSPAVRTLLVGFQGCSAGIVALRTAAELVRGDPRAKVLVVSVELCTLHFQAEMSADDVRGHALFADGAGAALVAAGVGDSRSAEAPAVALGGGASELLAGTEDDMAWDVTAAGFRMRLSSRTPRALAARLPDFVARSGRGEPVGRFAVHPGGAAILERVSECLSLSSDELRVSHDVLRDYGNLSSATIFFVLDRCRREAGAGSGLALAFGPGLTAESLEFLS